MPKHADTAGAAPLYLHGVRVVTPGHHEAVIGTATPDDAQTLADMVRHCGGTATLFAYSAATKQGAASNR